jgi:hypothetical protein
MTLDARYRMGFILRWVSAPAILLAKGGVIFASIDWRNFYGLFYGRLRFCCKTARTYAKPCQQLLIKIPSVSNGVQQSENVCKHSFLNYKSAALPAELCRRKKAERGYKSDNVKTETSERPL